MYKHLDGDYTGEIVIKIRPDADAYSVLNSIASHCRIPDTQFVNVLNQKEGKDQELHFMLTWQRVGDEISTLRRRFMEVITKVPNVRDAFVELVKFDVLEPEEVLRRQKQAQPTPQLQLAQRDAA